MPNSQDAAPLPLVTAAQAALSDVNDVMRALDASLSREFLREVTSARRLALHGAGREGLVMRALAMRLHHAGRNAFVVGDMTAQPVGPGDLLLVSAGPGKLPTVSALLSVAREGGARTLVFTAQPEGETSRLADVILHVPAQTMANDEASPSTSLPMGSVYELSLWLLCDLLIEELKAAVGITADEMRGRHTNLE